MTTSSSPVVEDKTRKGISVESKSEGLTPKESENQREQQINALIKKAMGSCHVAAFANVTPIELQSIANRYISDDLLRMMSRSGQNDALFTHLREAVAIDESATLEKKENLIYVYNFCILASKLREWCKSTDKTKKKIATGVFGRIERHKLASWIGPDTHLNLKYVGQSSSFKRRHSQHMSGEDDCLGFNSLLELDSKPEYRILFSCETPSETLIAEVLVAVIFRAMSHEGGGVNLAPCGNIPPFHQLVLMAKSRVNAKGAPDALHEKYWQDSYWLRFHTYGTLIGITQPTTITELHSVMCKRANKFRALAMEARSGRNDEDKLIELVQMGTKGGATMRKIADEKDIHRITALKRRHKIKPFQTIKQAWKFLSTTKYGAGGTTGGVAAHIRQLMLSVDPKFVTSAPGYTLPSDYIRLYAAARKRFPDAKTKDDLISEINKTAYPKTKRLELYYALSDGLEKKRGPRATTVCKAVLAHWESESDEEEADDSDADSEDDDVSVEDSKDQASASDQESDTDDSDADIGDDTNSVEKLEDKSEGNGQKRKKRDRSAAEPVESENEEEERTLCDASLSKEQPKRKRARSK